MKTVILAEKDEAGRTIAEILSNGDFEQKELDGINYFTFGNVIVVSAIGHIFTPRIRWLITSKSISELPKSEIVWKVVKRNKTRLKVLKELCKDNKVIVATDYDREGEVIGYNIVKKMGMDNPNEIPRMYYSALTEDEIRNAYQSLENMNEELLTQGLARNYADVIIGLNLTKGLTLMFKEKFKLLQQAISLGRVQSPLLDYIKNNVVFTVDEKGRIETDNKIINRIYILIDDIYYLLALYTDLNEESGTYEAEVKKVIKETVEVEQSLQLFNTNEIMSVAEIEPKVLMDTLESLYLKGYSTYPRTKSRYINPEILKGLEKTIRQFKGIPKEFSHKYCPVGEKEAKKQAIVLTEKGIKALFEDKIFGREKFVAELILNRTVKSFACPLRKTKTNIVIEINDEEYEIGWSEKISNLNLAVDVNSCDSKPEIEEGTYTVMIVNEKRTGIDNSPIFSEKINILSDTDLVNYMAEENIGTEATRSNFPSLLRNRHYTMESNLTTTIGEKIADIINKIGLDIELTSEMESRISNLSSLNELDDFIGWIIDLTKGFIEKLDGVEGIEFKCPNNHSAELVNTRSGLLMLCRICSSKGKFYRL